MRGIGISYAKRENYKLSKNLTEIKERNNR